MSARYKAPNPDEFRREFLESLQFDVAEADILISRVSRALIELRVAEGFGEDIRPEVQRWARGGISALMHPPAVERPRLEVLR